MKKTRGKRYSVAEREALLRSYKTSKQGITEWCKANGYNKGTIGTWLKRYGDPLKSKNQSKETQASSSGFVPLRVESDPSAFSLRTITIQYPNCVQVKIDGTVDVDLLQKLISLAIDV